ncbi:MAG: NADH-quinone oxidoreductase subunit M [Candidatus Kapabacteria bacterium]|nr:NADH-quinone oxidoreductase subunit M [Ignavibacteriota bacterium]MCW5885589.1 NADH-quinone oxidoreductase subunit M [Candidatus Kapabacteria bacterium]
MLTWITFLPILGMIAILAIPSGKDELSRARSLNYFRYITLFVTFIQLVLALVIYSNFNLSMPGINDAGSMQFVERFTWISVTGLPMFGNLTIEYFMGIDGISMPMLLLTGIVSFLATFASWGIKKAAKGYFAMYLLLVTGMMGVFVALDFFLFYVFWELMLLPMYFLIGIWGGPRKEYAAIKFFLYTLFGSVFMLLVMIALYFAVGSFNMFEMMNPANYDQNSILYGFGTNWRYIAFAALFVGFAIKVPIVPFHTWLPDAHVEAPTAISVILAGVLLKMGTYGMIRIAWPMFPDAVVYFNWWIAFIGMVSIVYGALCALAQFNVGKRDFKKLIAYSSVSHMGYVMLGLAALNTEGLVGAIFQMFNHGTITAMLFMIVGVLYDRSHTRNLDEFGGMANKMPVYTGIMTIAFFAAIGLPGLSGFVSEALVFLGAFKTYPVLTVISGLGIILGAGYMLWALQKVFFGKLPEKWSGPWDTTGKIYKNDDINYIELSGLVPLAIIVIYLGINPNPVIGMMTSSVNHFVELIRIGGNFAGL